MPARKNANTVIADRPRRSLIGVLLRVALVLLVLAGGALIYLDATVTERFEGRKWAVPAKVYGRALELWPGAPLSQQDVLSELRELGYRAAPSLAGPGSYLDQQGVLRVHTRGFRFWDGAEPPRRLVLRFAGGRLSTISDFDGRAVDLLRLEPPHIGGIYPAHNEDRILVRLEEVPESLVDALLAIEDQGFWEHHGLSLRGIARAAWTNLRSGRVEQGGSTLTQQLVKNFYLDAERTYSRKAIEAVIALLLELHYDKREILETYLNEVYLGQDGHRAIHGFGLASRYYFNRPLDELGVDEQALLVALVRGPSYYDPWRHPERATARRNLVLERLAVAGVVGPHEAERLQNRPLEIGSRRERGQRQYPGYLDLVRRQLRRDYSADSLSSEGLQIFTPFDPRIQRAAERALAETLDALDGAAEGAERLEGAVVVIAPDSGDVKAVVGGRQARFAGFNRAVDAVRPIGSLIKPAVYLTALDVEPDYTVISLIDDGPLRYVSPAGQVWEPKNFDQQDHGTVPMHEALARSYNQATARLGLDIGVPRVLNTVRRLGVERELPAFPSMLLGAASLTPLEVGRMYLTIASDGFDTPLRGIQDVLDADGRPLNRYPLRVERQFDADAMHLLQYMLIDAMREGTGRALYRQLSDRLVVAGKTGTTDELRDSWFVGYTSDLLAVVWVGRDDNGPTGRTGSSAALPVWIRLAEQVQPETLRPVVPEGIRYVWVDPASGLQTARNCEGARYVPFRSGSEPALRDPCGRQRSPVGDWWQRLFGQR
jgi:penicillin-binding protein 1B